MNRIDPLYYYRKRLEKRKRNVFEAFIFVAVIIMILLAILIYCRYGY
jgi:nitrate reductase NapE component